MAIETYYLLSAKAAGINHGDVQTGSAPTTVDMVTGWAINSGSDTTGEEAEVWANAERASGAGTWVTGPIPTTIDATNGNGWRLTTAKTGDYAAGDWTFSFRLRRKGGGDASPMTLGMNFLLWKSSNADGSSGSAIGSRQQITAASVGTGVTLSRTYDPGAISLSSEYVFILVAAEIGTSTSFTIVLREGSVCHVTTTDFTASGAGQPMQQRLAGIPYAQPGPAAVRNLRRF